MSSIGLTATQGADGIALTWDIKGLLPTELARQIPFAGALALNRSAQEALVVVRRTTAKEFTNRGAQSTRFFEQSFQISQYATKQNVQVTFGISRALQQGRTGAQLIDFEAGATRQAHGRNDFPYIAAIGSSLRPTIRDLLPRWAYPKALGLVDSTGIDGGVMAGKERTPKRRGDKRGARAQLNAKAFIIRDRNGNPVGIFRRVPFAAQRLSGTREGGGKLTLRRRRARGSGQSTLEILFFTPKTIEIKPRLNFHALADHTLIERINVNFAGFLAYASDQARQASNSAAARADSSLAAAFTGRRR